MHETNDKGNSGDSKLVRYSENIEFKISEGESKEFEVKELSTGQLVTFDRAKFDAAKKVYKERLAEACSVLEPAERVKFAMESARKPRSEEDVAEDIANWARSDEGVRFVIKMAAPELYKNWDAILEADPKNNLQLLIRAWSVAILGSDVDKEPVAQVDDSAQDGEVKLELIENDSIESEDSKKK